jgi:Fe-S oxidoreductase
MKSARFGKQCPINVRYAFNLYSAPGLMHSALGVLDENIEFTPKLLDSLFQCTACGACDIRCKRNLDLDILGVIEALKVKAVEEEQGPPEHKALADRASTSKNIYGSPNENRQKWMTEDIRPAEKADVLYFVGCRASFKHKEIAQATARILSNAETPFMLLDNEWCCGHIQFATGHWQAARELAEHNLEAIQSSGAGTVVTSCAEGYKTLKVDYPRVLGKSTADMGYSVVHTTEYIDQLIKDGKYTFKKDIPMKATYHDPCNLGRLGEPWLHWEGERKKFGVLEPPKVFRRGDKGVYEPPRAILNSIPGIELVEMERVRDNSWCCGAGAGIDLAFEDFALWIAEERLEEAISTGAEAIVSCCPSCKDMLNKAVTAKNAKMKVCDITEIMAEAVS